MSIIKNIFFAVLITFISYSTASAQFFSDSLIQFSGQILTSDSLQPIPFANIYSKSSYRGSISDFNGFFSFVASKGDTIVFSVLGYEKSEFIISDTLSKKMYSTIQLMSQDTINLSETVIYPYSTWEQFRELFVKVDIPDDDLERAKKNLDRERLRELGDALAMDGNENADYVLRQQAINVYDQGQYPSIQLLNPFAWAKFFDAWKSGAFKRKN